MANITDAFQPENGINLDDLVGIFAGTSDPSVGAGEVAPIGSIFIRNNGQLFQKYGAADTNWIVFAQGVGEAVKISATDTNAGYLNIKLLTSSSITKTVNNAGANETLTLDLANVGTAGTYRSVTTNAKGQVTAGTNPTTLAGYGITDAQGLDSDLTALANTASTGLYTVTGSGTSATRTLTGTANQITVTNGSGVAGNPTLSFPSTSLTFPGTEGVIVPSGTTAQRVANTGELRFNNQTNALEYFNGTTWVSLVASTLGTVTSVSTTQPAAGLTITGGPITTAGTFTFALANDLAAVEGLAGTGVAVRTATDTWATRTLTGTASRLSITNGDGISGNPTFDIDATYAGQSSIVTLGNVSTGTWLATTIDTAHGGTGRTTIGTANQMLGVNTTATGLEYKSMTAGTGMSLSFASGSITFNNTGVLSITGTTNQVIASAATGAVTLSLPQSINTGATPTFAQVLVAADPTSALQLATKQYVDNIAQGLTHKQAALVGSTANLTLSGTQTIDGIAVNVGDRVLVKDQTTAANNGIYIVAAGAWTRALDMDAWTEVPSAYLFVEEGTVNGDTAWVVTSDPGGTLGTTAITWVLYSSATTISAGTGLQRIGNVISIANIVSAGGPFNNITFNAQGQVTAGSNVAYITGNQNITLTGDVTGSGATLIATTLSATGVGAGTYTQVTVDTKGRVTAATSPTTLAGYGITDAQPLDADLTAIASFASTGFAVRTASNTWAQRVITVGSTKLSISNGDGVAGNVVLDVVEANLTHNNIGGTLGIAKGGTNLTALGSANQVLGVNAGATALEYKTITAGTGISVVQAANSITINNTTLGTVTSVAVSGSTGLTVGGSPITTSGTITLTLGTELQGLSALAANGVVVRTSAGNYAARSVVSGNGTVTITNPLGTAGNIGLDLTTVGTSGTYKSVTTDVYGRVTAGTNPTTLAGYGITDAVNTSQLGVANGVATLDAGGQLTASQIPSLAISDVFTVASQAAMLALTAQTGDFAIRTDLGHTYVLSASPASTLANWIQLADGPQGTVTSVATAQPAAGLTVTGGPITSSGTLTFALANDLAGVEGLATTGIAVRTAADTWATRTLVAGTGISITNADGTAGNITINNTALGTVTSVALTVPSILSVAGSPITTNGTLAVTLATQSANTFFTGPASGGAATPTFRTVSIDEMSDVVITSAVNTQVLAYNGTNWVNTSVTGSNAAGLVGVGQAGAAAWVLISGTSYRADFAHNLGTTNVVITVFDSSTLAVVIPDLVTCTNTNTVRVQVTGNTRTLKVVVVANGQSIVAGGSTPSSIIAAKDGVTVGTTTTKLNFTGQAISVTDAGSNTTNVNFGARYSYFANSLDNPNNSDWAINALASVVTDPLYASIPQRQFSNTVEQGVGFIVSIPASATQVTFKVRGRSQLAVAGATNVVQFRVYARRIASNSAPAAWSAATELANISIPASSQAFQYNSQTVALSAFSTALVADNMYIFEVTRRVAPATGTQLASNFLLTELTAEFS